MEWSYGVVARPVFISGAWVEGGKQFSFASLISFCATFLIIFLQQKWSSTLRQFATNLIYSETGSVTSIGFIRCGNG